MMANKRHSVLVNIQDDVDGVNLIDLARLERAATQVLDLDDVEDSSLSIVISTDAHLRELNRQYRGIDAPTDILTFPSGNPQGIDEDQDYLGDIIISLPTVIRRSKQENHQLAHELDLMVVHGTLHLLGYDHDSTENQQQMWAIQRQVLGTLGVPFDVPDFIHETS